MSSVDERIVKMVFDNAEFMTKIAGTISSLTQLNKATEQVANNSGGGLSAMGKAFEQAEITATKAGFHIQDVWLKVASILEYQVAGKIVKVAKDIANAMTFEGVADGFKEYELKMGSVQTIMAGTGASLQEVNKYLEELNAYSDKTIYSFADMTNNIGKFTNAGVKLDDAVLAIKGIANEAARSGANANEASRAMYNFSQALSAGYVKLIDWKSIENANMATKEFKDTLLEVASSVGTVEKQADGMYKVLTTNAQGKTMDDLVSGTKNFNDSLAHQWMTTEVLTKTMKIYATDVRDMTAAEKEAWEAELKSIGFTEDQILRFEELGSAATDAASEVKTFSMLIDTLKEAIGSGWAQTWEIIIGDFEEAKELWTAVSNVLGGLIDDSSKARNELLKGWDALGGRKDIIDALKNSFQFFVNVLRPIGTAMKEVFPPTTAKRLKDISSGILEFTKHLQFTSTTAGKIRDAAKGLFSLLDIGLKAVKAFVNAILPAGKGIVSLGGSLLDAAANLGKFITELDKTITESKLFENIFQGIANVVRPIFSFILSGGKGALTLLGKFFSSFAESAGKMSSASEIIKGVFDDISGGIDNIKSKIEKLHPLFEGLSKMFSAVGKALGAVFKQIGESISGFSVGGQGGIAGILNIFNALLSGGILYKLFSGVKQFSSIGESFQGVLDGLGNALNSFSEKVGAETLLNTAKAVAILAGSLLVVAMIDSDKLAGATTAISVMVGTMAGAMAALMKAVNSFSATDVKKTFSIFGKDLFGTSATQMIEMAVTLGAVSKAMISMGAAVLMMSVGLKIVASAAEDGHLWDSFAVISLMLAELTGVGLALSKFGGDKSVKGLTGMTTALLLMAAALKVISEIVADGEAWESLGILSIMLAELTGVVMLVENFGKYKMSGMTSLISLAISLNLCVIALKSVSDALGSDGNRIWESLGIISIMLAELAGITILMSQFGGFAALGGAGAILAATSLLIMVQALKQVSDALGQTDQHIWQALGVIGASLLVLAVGLTAMSASIPGAAGLLIASAALIVLGGALKIIGSLSLAEIGKGLLAMAGSLIILATGLTAMILALPGAVALTVAAAGLTVLAGALKLFGSMSLGEIVKSLGMLVVALLGIATVTTVLSVASPFILAFSAALLVFGAALVTTGAGLTVFAAGVQSMVAVLPMAIMVLNTLATALLNLLPIIAEKLMEALGIVAIKILELGPTFTAATVAIIGFILQALVESAAKIGEAVLQLIISILTILTDNIPKIAKAGADMMIAYMQAISKEIPRVVDEAYKCAIALINGLADAIESNNGELIEAVDHLMDAAIQAITQWLVEFTPLGLLIPEDMKEGIMSGEFNVKDALDDVIKNAVNAIKEKVADFKKSGEELIGGLIEGLKGTAVGKAVSAAAEVGRQIVAGLRSEKGLDEHSNSKKGILSGEELIGGVIEGEENKAGEAVDMSALLGGDIVGSLDEGMKNGIPNLEETAGTVIESITKPMTEAVKSGTEANNDYTKSFERNKEAQEKWQKSHEMTVKAHKELTAEGERAEKQKKREIEALKKHEDATLKDVKAMKTAHDQAATLHERNEQVKDGELTLTKATKEHTEAVKDNTKAQEANATAAGKSGTAAKQSVSVMEYASGVVEAFTQKYGHLYTALGEDGPMKVAAFAVRNLAEETYKASLEAEKATEKNKETKVSLEDMIKAFTEFKQKIYDSVEQVFKSESFFMDQFEAKTELTMSQVLSNMQSHIDGVTSWAAKLNELGDKGVNQGLLKYLMELGPKGYELVNAFSTATTEEIQQANAKFEQAAALPEAISNSTLASYAKAGLNCIQGFANGIDENVGIGTQSIETAATTYLKDFMSGLKEGSPSKATYQDGMWLIMGLTNGMNNYSYEAHNKIVEITLDIVHTAESNLEPSQFYSMGASIGQGLAEGMNSQIGAVRAAAEALSKAAAVTTVNYNGIHSPSRLYRGFGNNIAEGFAMGMEDGVPDIVSSAKYLSSVVKDTIEIVKTIAENDMELHPVISPVLDLTDLKENIGIVNSMFPGRSLALASAIGGSIDASRARANSTTNNAYTYGGATIYVTARDGESADQIADRVISKLDRITSRRKAVNGV